MKKVRLFVCGLWAVAAPGVFAVETQTWAHNSQTDFEKGTLKNLSLRSDGRLSLGPSFREIFDSSTAYLWALAQDSQGTLYAGGGGPNAATAKLFAIGRDGKGRVAAELPGLQIQAIAIDKKDRVYAATAPDGKVYRLDSGGKFDVFYDPKAKYIWALAINSKGELFVATGDSGEIHRVMPDGKGSVFFQTEETHARSLAVDAQDNLIVGTEPGGLVLRVSPSGEGFVLYQAAKREVTAVAVSKDGVIYAGAVGGKPAASRVPAIPVPAPVPVPSPAPAAASTSAAARLTPAPLPPPVSTLSSLSGGSELYRIATDDYPQRIWSHAQDVIYAIGFDASGRPILGTGNKGNVYRIDSELVSTLLVNAAPTQVTAFASNGNGGLFAATSNVGKVYQIGPEIEKQGSYESEPLDVGSFAYWGRARYKSDLSGGKLLVETRTGNLDRPQKNWSKWAPVDAASSRITSPSARFLQYRITLDGASGGRSPGVNTVEVAYMAKNVAPQFSEVESTPANYRFSSTSPLLTSSSSQTITLPALGQKTRTPMLSLASLTPSQTMTYAKGYLGARWAVSDPNSDDMRYKVEIRGIQEKEWKLLRDRIPEKFLSWDSTAFPDGEYLLRITASDAPDNPPDQSLTSTIESDNFIIDNIAPRISGLTATKSGNKLSVRWHAKDGRSVIGKAEYSLNGGEWIVVQPVTRLSDAQDLDYSVTIESAVAGEQTIAVRVTDDSENQSVEKSVVR